MNATSNVPQNRSGFSLNALISRKSLVAARDMLHRTTIFLMVWDRRACLLCCVLMVCTRMLCSMPSVEGTELKPKNSIKNKTSDLQEHCAGKNPVLFSFHPLSAVSSPFHSKSHRKNPELYPPFLDSKVEKIRHAVL